MQAPFQATPTDNISFRHAIKQELANIHTEVKNLSVADSEFFPAPELVFNDALFLLEVLHHAGIPTPDLRWSKDSSLRLTWHPEDGKATLNLYGDGLVIYNTCLENERPDEASFTLTDTACLQNCLTKLNRFFQ